MVVSHPKPTIPTTENCTKCRAMVQQASSGVSLFLCIPLWKAGALKSLLPLTNGKPYSIHQPISACSCHTYEPYKPRAYLHGPEVSHFKMPIHYLAKSTCALRSSCRATILQAYKFLLDWPNETQLILSSRYFSAEVKLFLTDIPIFKAAPKLENENQKIVRV